MRNVYTPKIRKIISLAERLPYFNFDNLAGLEQDRTYLKILLHRYHRAEKIIRLKKGLYTTSKYIDEIQKRGIFSSYLEFLANLLYQPSYLSLGYVLNEHNLLTEIPQNYTSMAMNKTTRFSNRFGHFIYHKVREDLFCGFHIVRDGDFTICKATRAKALFDFLYLRRNQLVHKEAIEELRLNLDVLTKDDAEEIRKYVEKEGSRKMREIVSLLFGESWKK